MYGYQPFNNNYGPQAGIDKINAQMNELEKMKQQLQQSLQPSINQTIQLAPQNLALKMVDAIEDVEKELAVVDTPFVNKDYTLLWIKNNKGEIRTFNIQEVKPKDEKDIMIEKLQYQVYQLNNKLEEMNNDVKSNNEQQSEQCVESSETKNASKLSNDRTDDKK